MGPLLLLSFPGNLGFFFFALSSWLFCRFCQYFFRSLAVVFLLSSAMAIELLFASAEKVTKTALMVMLR